MIDLIVPLGVGSCSDNDELRILLRSVEKNVEDIGRVVIVTQKVPDWLCNATIVPCEDTLGHNKDGNMITKVMLALESLDIHGDVCITCDDTVFMSHTKLADCPVLYNSRNRNDFNETGNRWHRRMIRTFDYLESKGVYLSHNYECHAPQVFNADILRDKVPTIDYRSGIGFGIFTLFRALSGETGGIEQSKFKTTHEDIDSVYSCMDKQFAGYKDVSFLKGLRERLFSIFNNKSKYEK